MEQALVDRLAEEIRYEFAREGPPERFPRFPDLPGGRYTDPAFFALEQERLWPRVWLLAGRVEDVPSSGSYWRWDDGGAPVVLVRGDDDVIRAFRNESPRRGPLTPYVDDSDLLTEVPFDAPGRFFVQHRFPRRTLPDGVLRCQQTGWCYDLQGRLVWVPTGGLLLDDIPYEQRMLTEHRCEVWDGWVFVNRDHDAPPLLSWLGPVADEMAQFQGATLRRWERGSIVLDANWKVATEAFQEVYHFKHIHQHDGVTLLDQRGATMGLFLNGHSRMVTPFTKRMCELFGMQDATDWRDDSVPAGLASLYGHAQPIPSVVPMVKATSTAYSIFPNLVSPVSDTGLTFIISWPIDVDHCLHEWMTFSPDWGEDTPEIEARRAALLQTPRTIIEEDVRNIAPMYASLRSPGLLGIPLSYQERRIYWSAETLDRVIGSGSIPSHLRVPPLLDPYVER